MGCGATLLALVLAVVAWVVYGWGWGLTGIGVAVAIFVVWRWTSVARGAQSRDIAIANELEPVLSAIEEKRTVDPVAVAEFASQASLRYLLYLVLRGAELLHLFPDECLDRESQATGVFAYWCMHPNEYGAAPPMIELHQVVSRVSPHNSKSAEYYVLRFSFLEGHWQGTTPMLGIVGPFVGGWEPYDPRLLAFARTDPADSTDVEELVDWFVQSIEGRAASAAEGSS